MNVSTTPRTFDEAFSMMLQPRWKVSCGLCLSRFRLERHLGYITWFLPDERHPSRWPRFHRFGKKADGTLSWSISWPYELTYRCGRCKTRLTVTPPALKRAIGKTSPGSTVFLREPWPVQ